MERALILCKVTQNQCTAGSCIWATSWSALVSNKWHWRTPTVFCLLPHDALQIDAGARFTGAQALRLSSQCHITGVHPHRASAYHYLLTWWWDITVDNRDKKMQREHCRGGHWRFHLEKRNTAVTTNEYRWMRGSWVPLSPSATPKNQDVLALSPAPSSEIMRFLFIALTTKQNLLKFWQRQLRYGKSHIL